MSGRIMKIISTLSCWYSDVLSDEYPFSMVSVISQLFCHHFMLTKWAMSSKRVKTEHTCLKEYGGSYKPLCATKPTRTALGMILTKPHLVLKLPISGAIPWSELLQLLMLVRYSYINIQYGISLPNSFLLIWVFLWNNPSDAEATFVKSTQMQRFLKNI